MARFKRSDYDSVLKEDSPYRNRKGKGKDKPTPLFLDDGGNLVMWSGKGDIPEVGGKVTMRTPVIYSGIVKSHFMEYGWVGVKVLPYPEYHEALSQQSYGKLPKVGESWTTEDLVYNYGCDLTPDS
jgi:hypothetical protein